MTTFARCAAHALLVLSLVLGLTLTQSRTTHAQGSQLPAVNVPSKPDRVEPSPMSLVYRAGMVGRVNPLGLFLTGSLQLRHLLYKSDKLALKDNYFGIGPIVFLSPAFVRAGIAAEVQPLSVLQLSASYEVIGYFSSFEYFQSFPTATANYSDAQLKALKQAGTNYPTFGSMLTLAVLLQVKVGPIALRSQWRGFHYNMKMRHGDNVWYDPILDVMSPKRGWVLSGDTDLLYVTKFGLAAGARYSLTQPFYSNDNFAPGETPVNFNGPINRIGPFIAYTFYDKPEMRFNAPTLVLVSQWHITHRYRAGQEISQALPWLAIAFQFKGDVFP